LEFFGILRFNQSSNATFSGAVSGDGEIQKVGTGTLTLTGTNTYTTTSVEAGTLQISGTGSIGSGTAFISSSAAHAYNSTVNLICPGDIQGPGALIKLNTNTLTLTGAVHAPITISAGTLQLGQNTTANYGVDPIIDHGTLVFANSNDFTFGGAISGSGSLIKK